MKRILNDTSNKYDSRFVNSKQQQQKQLALAPGDSLISSTATNSINQSIEDKVQAKGGETSTAEATTSSLLNEKAPLDVNVAINNGDRLLTVNNESSSPINIVKSKENGREHCDEKPPLLSPTQRSNTKTSAQKRVRCFSEPSSFFYFHNTLSLLAYSSFYLNDKYRNKEMLDESPALRFLFRNNKRPRRRRQKTPDKARTSGNCDQLHARSSSTDNGEGGGNGSSSASSLSSFTSSAENTAVISIQDLLDSYKCSCLAYKRSFSLASLALIEKKAIVVRKSSSFDKFLKNIVKGKRKSNSFCHFNNASTTSGQTSSQKGKLFEKKL
jgi:hypothetical protein